ncbi:RNA-directed DNA polymerase, eukaryota [Tanacetum coccineum]
MINEITSLDLNFDHDICYWSLSNDVMFFVSDARHIIDARLLPALDTHTQWDKCIPRMVNIFMWRFKLDRLPHLLNLSSRGMDIPSIDCPLCNANIESSDHLFFGCDFAKDIWNLKENDVYMLFLLLLYGGSGGFITASFLVFILLRETSSTITSVPFSFSWLHHRGRMACSWNDWLKSPLAVLRISLR